MGLALSYSLGIHYYSINWSNWQAKHTHVHSVCTWPLSVFDCCAVEFVNFQLVAGCHTRTPRHTHRHTHSLGLTGSAVSSSRLAKMKFESYSCLCVIISQLRVEPVQFGSVEASSWPHTAHYSSGGLLLPAPRPSTPVSDYKFNAPGFLWAGRQLLPSRQRRFTFYRSIIVRHL